jgi:hypothetical protein
MNTKSELYAKLDSFLLLEKGWDGYDSYMGSVINPLVIIKAKEIAALLPDYTWQAVPCLSGGVQLEYHDKGLDIEIYIESVWAKN